jgi:hypothetical protein
MDDNIWEYPFGDLDEDEEFFFREPKAKTAYHNVNLSLLRF